MNELEQIRCDALVPYRKEVENGAVAEDEEMGKLPSMEMS